LNLISRGNGPAFVLVPGLQGRWEYLRPTIDALAVSFRVITFALCGERGAGRPFDPARGLDNYATQVVDVLDQLHLDRAIICGISFGGLIAVRVAASHPARCAGLVLVSAPEPAWRISRRHAAYARAPRLFGPLFLAETPLRLRRELAAAFPRRAARWRFVRRQLGTLLRAPLSLARMGERARLLATILSGGPGCAPRLSSDCRHIIAPTLVVTGEPGLDRVTPVNGETDDGGSGYARLIRGARTAVIDRTGHLGVLTRPDRFAAIVRDFVDEAVHVTGAAADARAPLEGRDPHAA
jgi:pimeloyl-ACP methyl ester carboxylesterase